MNDQEKKLIEKAKNYVLSLVNEESTGHDYYHALRVYRQAMEIARNYSVDDFIVAITALLHDLDDHKISPDSKHTLDFLKQNEIRDQSKILRIIEDMSFSVNQTQSRSLSLEGQLVQDADRLDALGAIGIARCFAYGGFKQRPMYRGSIDDDSAIAHFYQKLFKLSELMNTVEARKIADERIDFMKRYLEEFYKQWQ